MRIRSVAVAVVTTVAFLAGSTGASSAPSESQGLEGPVALGGLAPAVRLNPPAPPAPAPPAPPTPSEAVVALVNGARAERGLSPLAPDSRLHLAAQAHSEDQASTGRMSHTGSNGSNAGQRITAAGFPWRSYAENVAYGYTNADTVVAAWMNSPGHRDNILSANTHVGVGLAYSPGGTAYWTLIFATPA